VLGIELGFCVGGWSPEFDADVQVEVLGEEILEFAAIDDPQSVATGCKGLGFCADPSGGEQDASGGTLFC
jgi:hypothetical protein